MGLKAFREKLDKLIYTYEEEPEAEASAVAPAAKGRQTSVSTVSAGTSTDADSVEGFLEALREATEDDRSEGHQAFWTQLTALQSLDMPESTRYQAAAKTAKGVTAEDLLTSITTVEGEVQEEVKVFEHRLADLEQEKVGDAKSQVATIETQLQGLEQQVAELEAQRTSLVSSISASERKFVQKRADFAEAVRTYRAELSTERQNIKTHLNPKKGA